MTRINFHQRAQQAPYFLDRTLGIVDTDQHRMARLKNARQDPVDPADPNATGFRAER